VIKFYNYQKFSKKDIFGERNVAVVNKQKITFTVLRDTKSFTLFLQKNKKDEESDFLRLPDDIFSGLQRPEGAHFCSAKKW